MIEPADSKTLHFLLPTHVTFHQLTFVVIFQLQMRSNSTSSFCHPHTIKYWTNGSILQPCLFGLFPTVSLGGCVGDILVDVWITVVTGQTGKLGSQESLAMLATSWGTEEQSLFLIGEENACGISSAGNSLRKFDLHQKPQSLNTYLKPFGLCAADPYVDPFQVFVLRFAGSS